MIIFFQRRIVSSGNGCYYYGGGDVGTALERGAVARGTGAVNRRRATVAGERDNRTATPLSQRQSPAIGAASGSAATATAAGLQHKHSRRVEHHDHGGRKRFQGVQAKIAATAVRVGHAVPGGRGRQAAFAGRVAGPAQTVRPQEERPGRRGLGDSVAAAATGTSATVPAAGAGQRGHRRTGSGSGHGGGPGTRGARTEARHAAQVSLRFSCWSLVNSYIVVVYYPLLFKRIPRLPGTRNTR